MTALGESGSRPAQLGRYELITRLGLGGMAEVHLALQRGPAGFEKLVVVKLVHENLATQRPFVDMLLDEARIAALVKHPNVVDIYDLGQADGRYFIAMEYLEGEPLLAVLRAGRDGQRLDVLSTARLVADTAEGLDAAHELRSMAGDPIELVHHDVSLGNIVVMYNGQVKLVDFGVAKASQSAQASSRVQGKFSYMAPEKLRGECGDRRSDLWSLGCVLWESLTLKRLFKGGSDSETMQQVLELPIRAPSQINGDVPADFDPIVLRALERDASRRYPTAKAIGADLEDVLRKHGYAAKNDLIAKYMQATFEPHIAARKKLLQQVSSKGRASRDVLEAAFNDRALASGTPIIPAGELRGTLVAPLQPVSAARDASSSHSLPHIPAHDASSSGSLPHIPAHDASSSHSLLHIPAHDASSSGSLPQIPAQGASSRGSLPQILAQGASSSGSLPQILAQGASRHHAPPGIPVTSTLSSALGAVGDGPTLVEPPIPLDRGWLQGPRKYAVAAGATIAILMVISVLLGRRGSEPAIELSSIPLTANPGDAPMRPSASQPPIAAPRAAALPTAAPPRPAASSATEPPPPPASSAPAPLPSRAPPPARREPAREAAVEARASVEPRHEVPSHNDRRDTARPAPTETPADLDIPVTRLVPSPAVRHAPIARSAPPPDRINPGEVSRAALQAWVHGDSRTAINLYRRTLQAAPSYAPAWRGIGLVYEKLGEKSAARAAFQRYLQLVPSAADAAGIRARLTPP